MHTTAVTQADAFVGSQVFWVMLALTAAATFTAARAIGIASRHGRRAQDAETQGARMAAQAQAQAQQATKRRGGGGKLLFAAGLVVAGLMFGPSLLHNIHASTVTAKPQPTPTVTVPAPKVTVNVPTPKAAPAPAPAAKWPLSGGETVGLVVFLGGVATTIGWFRRRRS